MTDLELYNLIEAILFASENPISSQEIFEIVGDDYSNIPPDSIDNFQKWFNSANRGLEIVNVAGGFQIVTRPEYSNAIRRMRTRRQKFRFSKASLETLAIIAYQQPVTAPEIESIRGVDSSGVLRNLLEKQLVAILGRKKGPGNPLLYGTTDKFLIVFGIDSLDCLPSLSEFQTLFASDSKTPEIPFEKSRKLIKDSQEEMEINKNEEQN